MENDDVWAELKSKEISAQHYLMSILRLCLFPIIIIIDLSVKISENPTKRLAFFRFCGNPLQRFELREAKKSSLFSATLRLYAKRKQT